MHNKHGHDSSDDGNKIYILYIYTYTYLTLAIYRTQVSLSLLCAFVIQLNAELSL